MYQLRSRAHVEVGWHADEGAVDRTRVVRIFGEYIHVPCAHVVLYHGQRGALGGAMVGVMDVCVEAGRDVFHGDVYHPAGRQAGACVFLCVQHATRAHI